MADRGARAGLAMLAARALYRRLRRKPPPALEPPAPVPQPELPEIERAIDDDGLTRLRGELTEELERRARRETGS